MAIIVGANAIEYRCSTDKWGLCRLDRGGVFEVKSPHKKRSRRHKGSMDVNANFLEICSGNERTSVGDVMERLVDF